MHEQAVVTTFLFTDIEGSTRLWEAQPERMRTALAAHDAITRATIERNRGRVVKMTGDGVHAVFDDPPDALHATLQLQQALDDPGATEGIALRLRCGLHLGAVERRDNDYFGSPVNRAARIMGVAHGGQVLLSAAMAESVDGRLPPGAVLRDLGLVRLRDLARPEHVFQFAHATLRQEFPALRSLEATPNNLPEQASSFVGRERELGEVRTLLGETRLLTLLGVGGLGKTRLSLQAAVDVMDRYPDGVWFVELAPLTDPRLVPQAVASVLGVKEDAGVSIAAALADYARSRRALLILDNCEHLAQACADLAAQLLRAGPQFALLASSREPLRVPGETTYHVPPLALPDPRVAATPDALMQVEAIRLFVERARAAQPAFRVTVQNAVAVAGICQRLDGIPLAIELAAARIRALSAEKIAERLDDRFRLLTGGSRTALPRQQTLRALIDWSYDLLDDVERALLRRLAVFAGGWTLEAAEAVGAGDGLDAAAVCDVLTRLVEKSLVALEVDGDRYRLLDTVREYSQDRLVESGDGDVARNRHLGFFVALAERASPELFGPDQASWLARIDVERENLLAAHGWCDRAEGGGEQGLRLVHAIKQYWVSRGQLETRHRLTVEVLAHPGAQARTANRCRGLFSAGQVCCFMGRYAEGAGYLEESLAIARELGDQQRAEAVLQLLGMAALGRGELARARGYLEEALTLAREQGDQREIAAALNGLAQFHRVAGDMDAAEPLYEDVLAIARELGDREVVAVVELNLAMVAVARGAGDRARALLRDVLAIAEAVGSRPAGISVLEVTAGLSAACRAWADAACLYGAAEAQAAQTGLHRDPADEAFLAPLMAQARQALGDDAFAAAEGAGRALGYAEAIARARALLSPG